MGTVKIDVEKCTGCGTCIEVCPEAVFKLLEEAGGGAPEKVWRLKTKEIKINLLEDVEA